MEWRRRRPASPGWYWLQTAGAIEVVRVYEYCVKPGAPRELEVAYAGRQHTVPVSDGRFFKAMWAGPIIPPEQPCSA